MTLFYFPGQTLLHDALLVRKEGGEAVFFIGDSFTPSGIDDYCLQNRNLLHDGMGFFRCLEQVREVGPEVFLINQHVGPMFRFTTDYQDWLVEQLHRRVTLLGDLLPWDDPNFGVDEGWARLHPYALKARPGETFTLDLRLFNHADHETVWKTALHLPEGWEVISADPESLRLPERMEGSVRFVIRVPANGAEGTEVVTADVGREGWELHEWAEALIRVRQSD